MTAPIRPLTHPALQAPGLLHGFFTREGGVSGGIHRGLNVGFGSDDAPEAVAENRRRAMAAFGLTGAALTTVHQVHGTDVARLEAPIARDRAPRADGLVTDRPGVVLGVLAADCAPVLLADRQAGVIGACHAGWKGALAGILEATVQAMEALGAGRARIAAIVGPCIQQASYEVGAEFRDRFLADDPDAERWFAPGAAPDKAQFDLEGFVLSRGRAAGLGRVEGLGLDTRSDPARFFSYRRATLAGEPDYGRQLSAIALMAQGRNGPCPG